MRTALTTFATALFLLCWVLHNETTGISYGCAIAPPLNFDAEITDEAALIVWDSEKHIEHFIRNANFETEAEDFGFLVPTPSIPSLHESGGRVLSELARITAPRIEWRTVEEKMFRLFAPGTGLDVFFPSEGMVATDNAVATPQAGVAVIDEVQVAGYDAAILKADDPNELLKWLEEHKYTSRPALLEWLEKYTSDGWYITAFRISRSESAEGGKAVARPVRMTFQTDRPFYPYREPADAREGTKSAGPARLLRLFVLADQKLEAHIGDTDAMPATTVWAGKLDPYAVGNINAKIHDAGKNPDADVDAAIAGDSSTYLTEFEDKSSPRQGTDELFLIPAKNQSTVERPPVINHRSVTVYGPDLPKWPFWLVGVSCVAFIVRRRFR